MKQASPRVNLNAKKTLKREFFEQIEHAGARAALVELTVPYFPREEGRAATVFAASHAA